MEAIALVTPTLDMKEPALLMRRAFGLHGETSIPGGGDFYAAETYESWLADIIEGQTNPRGKLIPAVTYFGQRASDGELVGLLQIRLRLNDDLLNYYGHIGYSVRPEARRKGYATQMLRNALTICRERGINRVLVTCDVDNTASEKTILAAGGVLEDIRQIPESSSSVKRYWIASS